MDKIIGYEADKKSHIINKCGNFSMWLDVKEIIQFPPYYLYFPPQTQFEIIFSIDYQVLCHCDQ